MTEREEPSFKGIIREIIEKSLFTERQIEILLHSKDIKEASLGISRGAYYRQASQARGKLAKFYYTAVLLRSLGVLLPDDMDVMSRLAEQLSVILDGEVSEERNDDILDVIERIIDQASKA